MPSLESLRAYAAERTRVEAVTRQESRAKMAVVGMAAQAAQNLDGYEAWTAHLDAVIALHEKAREAILARLAGPIDPSSLLTDQILRLKLALAAEDGTLNGLRQARNLIPTLIQRGKEADGAAHLPAL